MYPGLPFQDTANCFPYHVWIDLSCMWHEAVNRVPENERKLARIKNWLELNVNEINWRHYYLDQVEFVYEEDAVAFELAWGGKQDGF